MAVSFNAPKRGFRFTILTAAGLALVTCATFFLPVWSAKASYAAPHPLIEMMRPAPLGWTVAERPIGSTEVETSKAESLLRYDDAFVRTYRRGNLEVVVYVAYWLPGKMDPRMVLGHTPDACWIYDGAKMVSRDDRRTLPALDGTFLRPAYFRTFDWSGQKMDVVFWHILGGKPSGLSPEEATADNGVTPSTFSLFKSSLSSNGFGTVRHDQVFVRISTNQTVDDVVHTDLWPVLVASLGPTGIANGAAN